MKKNKQMSLRVSTLAKALVSLEQKRTGESESAVIERCVLHCAKTPEAIDLVRKYVSADPTLAEIMALMERRK